MAIPDFICKIAVKPMAAWLQEEPEDKKDCHICRISPLANYYMGVLQDAQAQAALKTLETAWSSGNGLTIAEAMDRIKQEVGEPLRKDLEELDCFAQTFVED